MLNRRRKTIQKRLQNFGVTGIRGHPIGQGKPIKRYANPEEKELHNLVAFVGHKEFRHIYPHEFQKLASHHKVKLREKQLLFERPIFITPTETHKISLVLKNNDLNTKEKLKRVKKIIEDAPEKEALDIKGNELYP